LKRRNPLSAKQVLFALSIFLAFCGLTLFLFGYRRDEKRFTRITSSLFTADMCANTLNMHYTLANPEAFGIYDYKALLPAYNAESTLQSRAATENVLAALKSVRTEKLSSEDAYLCKLLIRSLENSLAMADYPYYNEPLCSSSGMQSQLPILLAEYTFRSRRDVEDYLALLDQTDEYFASLLVFEQEKAASGLPMPASVLKEVRAQCDTIVTSEALAQGNHFLQVTFQERLEPLVQSGEITLAQREGYIAQNDRLLKTVLVPAYDALGDGLLLLEDDSALPSGLGSLPEGQEYYECLMISETGSYRPVPEIQELLTARFTQEYEAIHSLISNHPDIFQSDAGEFLAAFPYTDASQMLEDLQRRMEGQFPALPGGGTSVTVKPVSPSLEEYCAPAYYLTAPVDDTSSNAIHINGKKTPDGLELYTTLAHEGFPGHLYQTVYYNRNALASSERPVRQLLWYGGYLEGWALYVEFQAYDYAARLMQEQGRGADALYIDLEKHTRSLQLCLYSLLDIMIHYDNASYSQTADILENFGISDANSCRSVYTYIAQNPCNYPKYYLGYLEILSLKEQAQTLWGKDYSDYRFHCFLLDSGPSDFLSLQERLTE